MQNTPSTDDPPRGPAVPFGEAVRTWARIGVLSFGGPAGQIAVMHRVLVDEKRWISEPRFLHALNFCMLLPGPEAQQLATYVGWTMFGVRGGLAAGMLFILPGFVTMMGLSAAYAALHGTPWVAALFFGLKPAVIAIVVQAVLRIGGRALGDRRRMTIAAAVFIGIALLGIPFPLIVIAAAVAGWLWLPAAVIDDDPLPPLTRMERRAMAMRSLRVAAVCAVLWWAPVALLAAVFGPGSVFVAEGVFFGRAAAVTFGGAYAVLAYVAQQAVGHYGWLAPGQMLDGLGMAETTPGPLILVVQFVAFLGAYNHPGALPPLAAGAIGASVAVWVTFAPSFLFIFAGAPFVEGLRRNAALASALSGITAAVVGVILNLALWFALHVLFGRMMDVAPLGLRIAFPDVRSLQIAPLVIAIAAAVAIFRFRAGIPAVLTGAALCGLAIRLLG
ncbi:chromate efflux transporter [Longimicrobium terrae]|uniref:Chromate transporter n=1 Tax=Longimicrobium terrae TaxID=1639882 RepID=A0A841H2J1_9BACT|nr:chromate efflux transporter [Longimicrobium terrae]MBB4637749.1 chromate transporter [Longimicrobium terrae]MBB6072146.1 chromate transporter [Longimicrobium terrae]NNC29773.1 chromate efflux transporter [Longimicrobium terrae]